MAGTKLGGKRAAETNKRIHGADFYQRIGRIGGKKGNAGGFAVPIPCDCGWGAGLGDHYKRQCAGARGGKISRRTKSIRATVARKNLIARVLGW